jgi:predicted RND superfamily exporter protein
MGVLWTMGAMGWLGVKIDPLSVVLPTLVFVVGFTDAVHLVSDMQASRSAGVGRLEAAAGAARHLGPACLVTALTTMTAFGSLAVAHLECIQRFGLTCAGGTLIMFVAVQLVVPSLSATRCGEGLAMSRGASRFRFSTRPLEPAYRWMLQRPRGVAAVSLLATLACFLTSLQLRSDQRWTESLPETSETVQVTEDCDRLFGGSMYAYVVVEWPQGMELGSPEVLETLQDVHAAADEATMLGTPLSVLTLLESLRRPQEDLGDSLRHLRRAPPELLGRFVRREDRKAIVSVQVPDRGAARLSPDFARLEQKLTELESRRPGFDLHLTGTVVVAARNVYQMIGDLARSMTIASVLIFVMIMALFRSVTLGVLSIVPNVLPQAVTAAVMVWLDEPLTMTNVLTFSLCLGLSIDDTVHFLMRYRDELAECGEPRTAVLRTFQAVGGVMIATSLVLIAGFLAMLVSHMPSVRMFAILSCVTLLAAILGDLVILPSLILTLTGLRPREATTSSAESIVVAEGLEHG